MKVPESYAADVGNVIGLHVAEGIVPDRFVVNWTGICDEFVDFFRRQSLQNERILVIGGRTFPMAASGSVAITGIEDRPRYQTYNSRHSDIAFEPLSKLRGLVAECGVIMVHRDYVAETGYRNNELYLLNEWVDRSKRFYVVSYVFEDIPVKGLATGGNGESLQLASYRVWFDRIRSHMHLGYNTIDGQHIRVNDLSYFY